MDRLCSMIRKQRQNKNMTLKNMSEATSLSVSFLSDIERGVAKPSMASMRKIARALGISLLSFTDDADEDEAFQMPMQVDQGTSNVSKYVTNVKVVYAGQRKKLGYPDRPGYYELLTPDLNRQLEVLYVKIEPGFETGPEPIVDPPGEKFLYVLKGSYQTTINNEPYTLGPGDSIYYPANATVYFKNMSEHPVELILAVTPPGF